MKKISDSIGMSFGLDKCTRATFKRDKLAGTTSVELDQNTVIIDLELEEVYKYFGVDESNEIQQWKKVRKESYQRVREILKT